MRSNRGRTGVGKRSNGGQIVFMTDAVNQGGQGGQSVVRQWSNIDQIVVKMRSNRGRTWVKRWSNSDQIVVKMRSNRDQTGDK